MKLQRSRRVKVKGQLNRKGRRWLNGTTMAPDLSIAYNKEVNRIPKDQRPTPREWWIAKVEAQIAKRAEEARKQGKGITIDEWHGQPTKMTVDGRPPLIIVGQ